MADEASVCENPNIKCERVFAKLQQFTHAKHCKLTMALIRLSTVQFLSRDWHRRTL